MLEKPAFDDIRITDYLRMEYGLDTIRITFLPLGADQNTAVYRADQAGGDAWFVKLWRGAFDETAVLLPRFLAEQGVAQVITPLYTRAGRLWSQVAEYRLVVYPFVEGEDGYETRPSDDHWIELGAVLRRIQSLKVPDDLSGRIRREDFSPRWRDMVFSFFDQMDVTVYQETAARELAAFLKPRRSVVLDLLGRADRFANSLRASPPEFVLCHSDIHAGNLLMDTGKRMYLVDWDEPLFAPRERDLMCAGSGLMGGWRTPAAEETLFYLGYGRVQVNQAALSYYRYECIIMDIAAFCEQLLLSEKGGADRQQALHWLKSNFEPDGTIAIACRADRSGIHG